MAQEAAIDMLGMSDIHHYISIEGSIGAGKSTIMKSLKKYIKVNQCDATNPLHIDADNHMKDYYLLVDEPVAEWSIEKYKDKQNKPTSMLGAFYRDIDGMAFPFQIYTFMTRLRMLRDRLRCIARANFPRRIHIVAERSMRSDRLFFENLCRNNNEKNLLWAIYDEFFKLICEEVLRRQDAVIYLPVNSSVCYERIQRRARLDEVENNISEAYLVQLDEMHRKMIEEMKIEKKTIFVIDSFNDNLTSEQIDANTEKLMNSITEFVKFQ
jgi:deoxyadenosine/deoxycytidine kinase